MDEKKEKSSFFALITNRNFMLLWFSQITSMLAVNVLTFTLLTEVYKITNSSFAVSGLALSFAVPSFIFAAIAGVVADRVNRKTILVFSNLIRTALIFAILVPFSNMVPLLYVFAFLIATATQFFMPAEAAAIPSLTGKKELILANSFFMITLYGTLVLGYAAAGPLLIALGAKTLMITLGIFFAAATLFDVFIFSKHLKSEEFVKKSYTGVFKEIWEGWKMVKSVRDLLHPLLNLGMLWALIGMLFVLLPAFAKTVIGVEVEAASLIFVAPTGVGLILGVIALNLFKKVKLEKLVVFGFIMSGLIIVIMSLGQPLREWLNVYFHFDQITIFEKIHIRPVVMISAGLLGFFAAFIMIPAQTLLQQKTTEDIRGRVFGLLNTFVAVASSIPVLIAGALGDLISATYAFLVIGIITIIFGIYEWTSFSRYLRRH